MEQVTRIGIDHGYGNIKLRHTIIFQSGVVQKGSITELSGMVVSLKGNFTRSAPPIRSTRWTRVWDEDYYVLPLRHWRRNYRARC